LRPIQRAAKDDIISLVDGLMNANSATKPRMMPIKNLAKNGPVGVLKRCCITRLARTFQSTRTRRCREQYMPLVALCPRHFLADSIICMRVFETGTGRPEVIGARYHHQKNGQAGFQSQLGKPWFHIWPVMPVI
jgi:hypothetical protein